MPPFPPASPEHSLPAGHRHGPPKDPGNAWTRGLAVLAATVLVIAVVALQFGGRHAAPEAPSPELPPPDLQMLLTGRMAIGLDALAGAQATAAQILEQLDALAQGAIRERVRTAIIAAEVASVENAAERLDAADTALDDLEASIADAPPKADADEKDRDAVELVRISSLRTDIASLRAIHAAGAADEAGLTPDARAGLLARHGYFGEVALMHGLDDADPARADVRAKGTRTVITLVSAVGIAMTALLIGLMLFVLAMVRLASPRGIRRAYAPPAFGGSVYLETFALFLAGFIAISILGGMVQQTTGRSLDFVLPWLLLLVPFWPLLRRQRWSNHRHALGWTRGRGILREVVAGVLGYVTLLPVFAFGVLCTILLMALIGAIEAFLGRDAPEPITHPIMERLISGDVATFLVLLSMVAVWAPLAEETIFRGAFFHHLRGRWRVALSALATGFVFAVIHPQGLAAVPALMALGCSFALLREWRGSLIAPMVAHAMHNGFLVTMLWLALR